MRRAPRPRPCSPERSRSRSPVVLILLNGLRRPACDPAAGLMLYSRCRAVGRAGGRAGPRGGVRRALARRLESSRPVFTGSLIASLWPVARGPQVFAFHHLGGMFPGPIYDEAINPSRALWIFRGATLLYAGACAGAALSAGPAGGARRASC